MLTVNQQNGIHLEKVVSFWLKHKMKLGDKVDHNRFDEQYGMDTHNVVDIVVKGKALVECTNPKKTTFMPNDVMENKLNYFRRVDRYHSLIWFLIVSFASFSESIKKQIKKAGIILIELGIHADGENFWEIVKRLFHTRLYSTLTEIVKSSLVRPSRFLVQTIQQSLFSSPIPVTTSISTSNTKPNLHQHNISIEEEYRQYYEDMKQNEIWSVNHPHHQRIMDMLT